jgi:hypothetical protein
MPKEEQILPSRPENAYFRLFVLESPHKRLHNKTTLKLNPISCRRNKIYSPKTGNKNIPQY